MTFKKRMIWIEAGALASVVGLGAYLTYWEVEPGRSFFWLGLLTVVWAGVAWLWGVER